MFIAVFTLLATAALNDPTMTPNGAVGAVGADAVHVIRHDHPFA